MVVLFQSTWAVPKSTAGLECGFGDPAGRMDGQAQRLGLEFGAGLGGLGEGVGEGLVPAHGSAAGAQFPRALFAQGCPHDQGYRLRNRGWRGHVGVGGAQADGGGVGPAAASPAAHPPPDSGR